MLLRFTKMHGLGNDFVMLDLISQNLTIHPEQIAVLGDRRTGVGFDQLLIVEPPSTPEADFKYRIFNADGSEAEHCGNGARCFLRFVRDRGLTTKTKIILETRNAIIECALENDGNITVNMGPPILEPDRIPFLPTKALNQCDTSNLFILQANIASLQEDFIVSAISVGNPHAVLVVDSVEHANVDQIGTAIGSHPAFPEGVNVGFMEIVSRSHIKLRVFERGCGETKACGTGACAAVIAAKLRDLVDDDVKVTLTGGELSISWQGGNNPVMMTGPATRVYEGRLHI